MSVFLKVKGIICLLFAVATLIIPGVVAPLYGFNITFTAMYFTNLFGVCFLGIGLICWFLSNAESSILKSRILLSLAIADTIGFGFTLNHQLFGAVNALGWTTVVLWAAFAAGCWIFQSQRS